MIFILLFSLIVIFVAGYLRFSKDIFAPPVIKTLVFIISAFFVAININTWNIDIGWTSLLVISSGLVVFLASSIFAYLVFYSSKKLEFGKNNYINKVSLLGTPIFFYVLSVVYMVINLALYYLYVSRTAITYGSDGSFSTILEFYRQATIYDQLQDPTYLVFMNLISAGLASFYLMIFTNNYVLKVKQYKYLLPVLLHALIMILSSSRIGFIYLVASISVMIYLFSLRAGRKVDNKKVTRNISIGILLFFILFFQLGTLTGKSQKQDSAFQNISIYTGSSILALDSFLNSYTYDIKNFGSETLYGITNLAKRSGLELEVTGSRFLEFRDLGDMPAPTNVYTSYRRLIHDYGYVGLYLIEMISGYLLTLFYLKLKHNQFKNFYLSLLIYTFFLQTIVVSSIEEKLIVNLPTITTALLFVLYVIFTRFFLRMRKDGVLSVS